MLLSLGLGALNAQLLNASYTETKKRQAIIKDALTAYLGANKRLPCPAPLPDGIESPLGGNCAASAIGIVPYATLGLGKEIATDGWGNFMSYSPVANSGTCPDWSSTACFGAKRNATYELAEGTVAAATIAAQNLIAAVVSHGPNGLGAWSSQGSRNALPVGCEEAHNAIAPSVCALAANRFFKGERAELDDVVATLQRDEAINTLARQGTLKTADGQVAEDIGSLRNQWMDSLLTNCAALPPAMPRDPWGGTYIAVSGWPSSICSTRGGPPAVQACGYINKSEVNAVITKMGGTTCP